MEFRDENHTEIISLEIWAESAEVLEDFEKLEEIIEFQLEKQNKEKQK